MTGPSEADYAAGRAASEAILADYRNRPADQVAQDDARMVLSNALQRLAVDVFGAVRHDDPIPGYRTITRTRFEPATAPIQAAVWLRNHVTARLNDAVDAARGAGASWADVAAALGIEEDDLDGQSPAEAAFAQVVHGQYLPRPRRYWSETASWRCSSCDAVVIDHGPYGGHPDDVETGHAEGCNRHAAEVATYTAAWDDQ